MHGARSFNAKSKAARKVKAQKKQKQLFRGDRLAVECPTPGKFSFPTRKQARAIRQRVPTSARLAIYLCSCGCYHLGKPHETREQARITAQAKLDARG